MKFIDNKPYIIFWVLIPIILVYGFSVTDETVIINIYDTYYVFLKHQIYFSLSFLFAIYGILHGLIFYFNRKIIHFLTTTHVLITIAGIVLLTIISPIFSIESTGFYEGGYQQMKKESNRENNILLIEIWIVFIILLAQLLFIVNLISTLFRKKT